MIAQTFGFTRNFLHENFLNEGNARVFCQLSKISFE